MFLWLPYQATAGPGGGGGGRREKHLGKGERTSGGGSGWCTNSPGISFQNELKSLHCIFLSETRELRGKSVWHCKENIMNSFLSQGFLSLVNSTALPVTSYSTKVQHTKVSRPHKWLMLGGPSQNHCARLHALPLMQGLEPSPHFLFFFLLCYTHKTIIKIQPNNV